MKSNSWWAWRGDKGFSLDLVDYILEEGAKLKPSQGTIFGDDNQFIVNQTRRSKVAWLDHLPEIKDHLFTFVLEANRRAFNFDVQNAADVQFTEYHALEKGHYDWHRDWSPFDGNPFQRKLSITVQLSDSDTYEGGEFEMENTILPDWITEKGTVLIFPSFVNHRVKPVTKGIRRSLVSWFEGPSWR